MLQGQGAPEDRRGVLRLLVEVAADKVLSRERSVVRVGDHVHVVEVARSVAETVAIDDVGVPLHRDDRSHLEQREVPEQVRTSAFARSETVLQLAWVLGGGIGIVIPVSGAWGLGIAAAGLTVMVGVTVRTLVLGRRPA